MDEDIHLGIGCPALACGLFREQRIPLLLFQARADDRMLLGIWRISEVGGGDDRGVGKKLEVGEPFRSGSSEIVRRCGRAQYGSLGQSVHRPHLA